MPIAIVRLFFLKPPGVRQQYLQQIAGPSRTINWTTEPLPDQARQVSGVIDVCVSNQHRIYCARIEGRLLPVSFPQFLESLEHSAIDEDAGVARINEVF